MQITKVTAGFQNQTAERKRFTDEELQKEFDYYMAQKLLENLREGSTVLVATHLLRDLGELLDTVAILTENGIVLEDADAIRETGKSIEEYYLEVVQ